MTKRGRNFDSPDDTSFYWVYILRCGDDTLYTGTARDVECRAAVHNAGKGAKYTRSRLPVTVAYREECSNRSAALKREVAIKRMTRTEKLALIALDCPPKDILEP